MTLYRALLLIFLLGNVFLFTSFMTISSQPWEAALLFLGYVLTNAPIVVSVFAAGKIDETLRGHWLNWLNILIPVVVGVAGLIIYASLALNADAHPAIFLYGPLLITAGWSSLFGVLVIVYVFVPSR